ncbi:MAG TPA: argininosuccinate synthase [Nitrososphaeraceae archaeon]|nr:argininosuccinate synthase [Nitrososphaeraceae archaeon]
MVKNKCILAYSGGLDTSVCIKYLQLLHDFDVITVTVDCGQNDDFEDIEKRSKEVGAIGHYYIDAKEEFISDYIIPCIKANGLYQNQYPLGTALARPLIAKKTVDIANKQNAKAIAHGCTGKGNDQIRFDITIRSLNPNLRIIAPIRDMNLTRDIEIQFAKEHNIHIPTEVKKYSIDMNIWGRSIEGGDLENPFVEPPNECFKFVKFDNSEVGYLDVEYQKGIPISVDGKKMEVKDLVNYINFKAGSYGVGIVDHIEDRVIGIKSREVYECPAAIVLIKAHQDLEKMVLTSHELRFKHIVEEQWSWMTYSGLWQDPLLNDLDKFIDATQNRVTGKVKMRMQNGSIRVVGRDSEFALYRNDLATYTSDSVFDQQLAKGFSELWGLQSITANSIEINLNKKENKEDEQ